MNHSLSSNSFRKWGGNICTSAQTRIWWIQVEMFIFRWRDFPPTVLFYQIEKVGNVGGVPSWKRSHIPSSLALLSRWVSFSHLVGYVSSLEDTLKFVPPCTYFSDPFWRVKKRAFWGKIWGTNCQITLPSVPTFSLWFLFPFLWKPCFERLNLQKTLFPWCVELCLCHFLGGRGPRHAKKTLGH